MSKQVRKGLCGKEVRVKVWKQGHSIRCQKSPNSPRTEIRYWQPANIDEEIKDFCRYCANNPFKLLRITKLKETQ